MSSLFSLRSVLFLVSFCLLVVNFNVLSQVTVTWQQKEMAYSSNVPLSEVLADVGNNNIYWPAAAIFKSDIGLEDVKNELLAVLSRINSKLDKRDTATKAAIVDLQQQVEGWTIARRSNLIVDYDLSRLYPKHNPWLVSGNYFLNAAPRQSVLEFLGAVKSIFALEHLSGTPAYQYPFKAKLLNQANLDFVYVIAPSGKITKAATAYWNRENIEVMPGSTIYVPFREGLFNRDYQTANALMLTILQNRVLASQ
jgi:hypothetical protein